MTRRHNRKPTRRRGWLPTRQRRLLTCSPMPPAKRAIFLDPLLVLAAVREVAELSGQPVPQRISTRAWDASRHLSDRFADAPAARHITERLGISWRRVVELAFIPSRGQLIALGHALGDAGDGTLTAEQCDFALNVVARRLRVSTLTPGQYRAERDALLAALATKPTATWLPTEDAVTALIGSWDRALAHAGLRRRIGLGGQVGIRGVSIVELLERCYEHHGTEPISSEMEQFARANGIPYPRRDRSYPDYVREWKERRQAAGLPVPDGPPPTRERPDYSKDVGAARPGERRIEKLTEDDLIAWVARYLRAVPPGERPSKRAYDRWARNEDGAPWASRFHAVGGWSSVRARAVERYSDSG